MIYPPALIDLGTDEDAGFWSDALRFARFPHTDYPARPSDSAAQATDRRGEDAPCSPPAALSDHSFHSSANSPLEQAKHD